jgi:choline kinase
LVVNPDSGPQIKEHVLSGWPSDLDVSFAVQERPFGTVHAVLAAKDSLDRSKPFAVVNADDLYGPEALSLCAQHLAEHGDNVIVGFRLRNAVAGGDPVTRGICQIEQGRLVSISERRQVQRDGERFSAKDGLEPVELDPDSVVSMNLWGFAPGMWEVFEAAMNAATDASEEAEVLLPETIAQIIDGRLDAPEALRRLTVLVTESRCIGVTHPSDLETVRQDLLDQIARSERQPGIFGRSDAAG